MITTTPLTRLPVKFYRFGMRMLSRFSRNVEPPLDRLVFVFGGRARGWLNLGLTLYRNNPDFKESIRQCNAHVIRIGGAEILSYFEEEQDETWFDDELKYVWITAIQVATIQLFFKKRIFPNAVLGVSLGEAAALYAAGAITWKEALQVSLASFFYTSQLEKAQYNYYQTNLSLADTLNLAQQSPVWFELIYEVNVNAVVLSCHEKDRDTLVLLLKSRQIEFNLYEKTYFPYHTTLINKHRDIIMESFKNIRTSPLICDYFSCTTGENIPAGTTIGIEYWYKLMCVPVLLHTALQDAIATGFTTFVQIGVPALSERQLKETSKSVRTRFLNTFTNEAAEEKNLESVFSDLSVLAFERSPFADADRLTYREVFIKEFDAFSLHPHADLEYLKQFGPVHFIPKQNAWLVLDYANLDLILKQPLLYSSDQLKIVDAALIGAEPDVHKINRDLIMPFFSSTAIAGIGRLTSSTASVLFEELLVLEQFDFLKDFTTPLSQTILCNFWGLTVHEGTRLETFTGLDPDSPVDYAGLSQFFDDHLSSMIDPASTTLPGRIKTFINAGKFTNQEGITLLRLLWIGGVVTTISFNASIWKLLVENPATALQLQQNENLRPDFINECLRLAPPANYVSRVTTAAVTLSGVSIPAGARILLSLESGNRDPVQFPEPNDLLLSRPLKRNFSFGTGIHQCIGIGIAKAAATALLDALLERYTELSRYSIIKTSQTQYLELKLTSSMLLKRSS